jgi:hypothetical protein
LFLDLVPSVSSVCTPIPNDFIAQELGQNDGRNLFSNDIDDVNQWYVEFIATGECIGEQKKWEKIWCKNLLDGGTTIRFDRGIWRLKVEIPDLPSQNCSITGTIIERCHGKVPNCYSSCWKAKKRVVYSSNFTILSPQLSPAYAASLEENKDLSKCEWCEN